MSYFPHHPFLTFMKLFAFNSAKTPEKSSIIFIIYNCILVSLYIIILYFQIKELYGRKLHEMNLIVLHIQIVALVFAFFATIITNLWYSKKYIKCLKNLSRFDNSLSKLGFFINNKKITRIFYVTFCLWLIIFLYVSFTEYYYSVFLKPYMTWIYWCSYYLPLGLTHFASYFLIMSLYFLLIRYSLLTKILKNNYKHPDVIRFFVKVYFDIIEITNEMVSQFSLQICALFSIAAITVTNNSFLIVKGNYSFWQYLILVNVLLMHIIEIVLVVWAHYRIHQEVKSLCIFILFCYFKFCYRLII